MSQHAIRNRSQTSDRLDAGFHLCAQRMEERTKTLETLGASTASALAQELMGELTGEQRERVLGALRAGSRQGTMGTFEAHSLVRKSPFLSLVLLEEFLPQAKQAAQQEMARAKVRVMAIGSFEQRLKDALPPKKRSKSAP